MNYLKKDRFFVYDYLIFRVLFISYIFFIMGIITYTKGMIIVAVISQVMFLIYCLYLIFGENRRIYNYTWKEMFTLPLIPKKKDKK